MSTARPPTEQRFVLYGVDRKTYGRLLRAFGNRPGVRLTHDPMDENAAVRQFRTRVRQRFAGSGTTGNP